MNTNEPGEGGGGPEGSGRGRESGFGQGPERGGGRIFRIDIVFRETWLAYLSRFGVLFLIGFLVFTLFHIAVQVVFAAQLSPENFDPQNPPIGPMFGVLLVFLLALSFVSAFIVAAGYDARMGRGLRFDAYLSSAIGKLPLLLGLNLAVAAAVLVPILLATILLVPFLGGAGGAPAQLIYPMYVVATIGSIVFFAPWVAVIPAAIVEGRGFDAMSRSLDLTRGHRWPIRGLLALLFAIAVIFEQIVMSMFSLLLSGSGQLWLAVGLDAAVSSLTIGVFSVMTAIIYAHLRALRGEGDAAVGDVFS